MQKKGRWHAAPTRDRERGVVIFFALIALVVILVSTVALLRSVDTGTLLAGNLAFRQRAVQSADAAVERSRNWLIANAAGTVLYADIPGSGYYAERQDPARWDTYFSAASLPTSFTDASGNQITYVIHRLCTLAGDPSSTANSCVSTLGSTAQGSGNSQAGGRVSVNTAVHFFYRVTVQVTAPRSTSSYVQTVIEL
jgi:Tfp pilus assembly protein PilX